MSVRHMVNQGDTLWGLACRYLGGGAKFPMIVDHHNSEAARFGSHSRLLRIKDPNLIYVGQTIVIPPRVRNGDGGSGTKSQASQLATGIQLKATYEIKADSKKTHYKTVTTDYTIEAGLTGRVDIENLSSDRYQYNLSLVTSRDKIELQQKLSEFNDQAFKDLTEGVKMSYESGRVTVKAPFGTYAKAGPFTCRVEADAPNHFAGSLQLDPLSGTVEKDGRKFKFTAQLEIKAEVTWHPSPKGAPEPVKDTVTELKDRRLIAPRDNGIDWSKAAENVDDFIAVVTISIISCFFPQIRMSMVTSGSTTSIIPFTHIIDGKRYGQPEMI